jgi:DNA polymerase-4
MTVRDAKLLYPGVIVRTPDPPKYRAVHLQFRKIFKDYSPVVVPKSIDEAVIDFTDTYALFHRDLRDIGREIKQRMRREIGEWISCSIDTAGKPPKRQSKAVEKPRPGWEQGNRHRAKPQRGPH